MAAKDGKTAKSKASIAPMSVQMGWIEAENAKDVRAYARGIVQQRFVAQEESWFGIKRFRNGFLWEAHQGGDGKGYINAAAAALDRDPEGQHWFQTGDRAYRIIMQDGKPFPHLLPSEKSVELLNSGSSQLERGYSLTPFSRKGTGWLATGAVLSSASVLFFLGSLVFYGLSYNPGPSVRATDLTALPHMKWPLVSSVGIEEIVQKLQMRGGNWSVDKRSHQVEGLDKLRKQRAELERANRERDDREDQAKKEAAVATDAAEEAELMKTLQDATAPETASDVAIPVGVPQQDDTQARPQQNSGDKQ